MAVRFTIGAMMLLTAALLPRAADALVTSGSLVRASQPAVYYVADDGKRYVFPNEKTYRTWYSRSCAEQERNSQFPISPPKADPPLADNSQCSDFSQVQHISDTELAALPLGGNVTYKPGSRLVKIESDPKVYAVDHGGVLRWIETEGAAIALFGTSWSRIVDDVPVAFFVNYRTGTAIRGHDDYDPGTVANGATTIAADLAVVRGTRPAPASTLAIAPPPPPQSSATAATCASNPSPVLTADITPLSGISLITPPGSHTHGPGTVTTHSYIWTDGARVPVIAPVDMVLEAGSYSRDNADSSAQYLLFFRVSCEVKVKFDHIDEPIAAIRSLFPSEPKVGDSRTSSLPAVAVRAGDTIAHTMGTRQANNWDFGAYNTTKAAGVNNDHADCPYAYYLSAQRTAYAAKFGSGVQSDPDTPRTFCNADGTSAVGS